MKDIRAKLERGEFAEARSDLLARLDPEADFATQYKLARLMRRIPAAEFGLRPLRVAILPTSTVDQFAEILRLYLARDGFDAEFFIAEFDTVYQTALDPDSALYAFEPDLIWIFTNHRDLGLEPSADPSIEAARRMVEDAVERSDGLVQAIRRHSTAQIIRNNADRPLERVFGNLTAAVPCSHGALLARFNLRLAESSLPGTHVFDLGYLADWIGLGKWHDEAYWYHSKHAFGLNAVGRVAHAAARFIRGLKGLAYKCLVVDLDNTLWGGVIGDDGIEGVRLGEGDAEGEAFLAFQRYLKALKERGVILAVCSKNDPEIAEEAVRDHPAMVLTLGDFAVFACSWSNKADTIRAIAEALEIGLDSMVFVDDNPVERAQVRGELPMVAVPELPDDPALYVRTLDGQLYFEAAVFSEEDKARGRMYRDNAQRNQWKGQFSDIDGFLRDLAMEADVGDIDARHLPRVSQLINKSNQFHLTTTRYSESQLTDMLRDPAYEGMWFKLRDRFGDNGLVSAVLLNKRDDVIEVDTWVMSCRVLSRGMEDFIHNAMVATARESNAHVLRGRYIPTKKNNLVADLYGRLGWDFLGEDDGAFVWELPLHAAVLRENHIKRAGQ